MAKNQKGRKMKTKNRALCFCRRQSYRILRIDRMQLQSSVLFVVHLLDGNSPGSDSTKTNGQRTIGAWERQHWTFDITRNDNYRRNNGGFSSTFGHGPSLTWRSHRRGRLGCLTRRPPDTAATTSRLRGRRRRSPGRLRSRRGLCTGASFIFGSGKVVKLGKKEGKVKNREEGNDHGMLVGTRYDFVVHERYSVWLNFMQANSTLVSFLMIHLC